MNYDFASYVALVTGGGSGIGRATALLFAEHGAKVVVSDIDETGGLETVDQIRLLDETATFIKADVSKHEECKHLIDRTIETYGRLDIAVNNAGISGESNPIADMSIEGWNKVISTNLDSIFYCMKYEIKQMEKQHKGAIINISSILGKVGFANAAGYVAAKHGILGLTKNGAIEYSSKGIRINAVGPAFINTPMLTNAGIDTSIKEQLIKLHPIGRFGEAHEIAELIIWLASEKASFITGSYYAVDGGYLSQ